MFPVSRRCLLCSGRLSLSTKYPTTRRRSAVPAAATAPPPSPEKDSPTMIEVPTICLDPTAQKGENLRVKPYEEVPGPVGLPFIGSLLDYVGNGPYSMKKMHLAIIDRFRQYGPIFKETLVGSTHVHIIEPHDVKELIRLEGVTPRRITLDPMVAYRKLRKRNIGMSNLQGEEWRRLRQPFNHLMFKPGQINTYIPKVEECADDFCTLMRELRTPDGEVPDYMRQMQRWTLETLADVVLNTRIGCMDKHLSELAERVITSAIHFITGLGDLMYSFPLYKYGIYTETWRKFATAQDFFFEFVQPYVLETIESMKKDERAVKLGSDYHRMERNATFLESLLAMHTNTELEVISELLNDLLLGAIDTVSSMFSFVIYNLSRNPHCQEKVYEEINAVLPPGTPITPEALQMLPYLKAFVKESTSHFCFRLFPAVDGTSRILDTDITLSGYNIPANTIIRIHAVAGMMSEYVPEPEIFKPERWLRTADSTILASPYLTMAFGVGPRMCLGKRLAELQINIGIIKLLQNFRFEWHHPDVTLDAQITNRPSRPVQPKVIDR
ncbi:Cytochrome P450 10 [Holothuria leucospilota]|uniref:Cytochrome P450 10 n=1 Tax=Holothuria leucospilota TaxID=206669 RepID=A0A9Q1HDS9_HOLLE|nr:Cytochrome P450 10 [Holothuria leucospilota]